MQIRIIRNGTASDWFCLTKRIHRELLRNPPEQVILRLGELYPRSPDYDTLINLDFDLFTILTRESVLFENAQQKKCERHMDPRALDAIDTNEYSASDRSVEEEYIESEARSTLQTALCSLTPTQQKRLAMFVKGVSCRDIARQEGISHTAVEKSISQILRNLKKFFYLKN